MEQHSDGVVEALSEAGHRNAMILARTLEPLAHSLAEVAARRAERATQEAAEQTRAYGAQRAAARAYVEPVRQESWWAGADERSVLDVHQVAAAWAPHDEQAAATLEMIRTQARTRFGVENVEHLADRVQAREQVSAEVSRPAHEAQQLRQRATVLDAEAQRLTQAAHWTGREAGPDTTAAAGKERTPEKVSVESYEHQAAHARDEAERLRTQAAELEDPTKQAERLRALGRAADAEVIALLSTAEAIEQHPDWGQDEATTAGELRDQAHTRQSQGEAYRDHAAALELEAAPSPDVERQAMISQSIEGITETDAVTARKIAATANAHPARMAASVPTKAPKARKARAHGAGRDQQVTMGR